MSAILLACTGFEWDDANLSKNWQKHGIHWTQCEQVFFNQPLLVLPDTKHSDQEKRYYALGKTDDELALFVVFTVRAFKIRVISARRMNKKERAVYEQAG